MWITILTVWGYVSCAAAIMVGAVLLIGAFWNNKEDK